jgi:hypothetical protein
MTYASDKKFVSLSEVKGLVIVECLACLGALDSRDGMLAYQTIINKIRETGTPLSGITYVEDIERKCILPRFLKIRFDEVVATGEEQPRSDDIAQVVLQNDGANDYNDD